MIHEGDIHDAAGRTDLPGLFDVLLAGDRIAGRMIVRHQDFGGVVQE